jgi:exonuclease III
VLDLLRTAADAPSPVPAHGLLAQGWTDAVRALHPGERVYTFWDYFLHGAAWLEFGLGLRRFR